MMLLKHLNFESLPVAEFDGEKLSKTDGVITAPFYMMTERSRIRILGENYWAEGKEITPFWVNMDDSIFYPFLEVPVYGRFICYSMFHGGHPFDKSQEVIWTSKNIIYPSMVYSWSVSILPDPTHVVGIDDEEVPPHCLQELCRAHELQFRVHSCKVDLRKAN